MGEVGIGSRLGLEAMVLLFLVAGATGCATPDRSDYYEPTSLVPSATIPGTNHGASYENATLLAIDGRPSWTLRRGRLDSARLYEPVPADPGRRVVRITDLWGRAAASSLGIAVFGVKLEAGEAYQVVSEDLGDRRSRVWVRNTRTDEVASDFVLVARNRYSPGLIGGVISDDQLTRRTDLQSGEATVVGSVIYGRWLGLAAKTFVVGIDGTLLPDAESGWGRRIVLPAGSRQLDVAGMIDGVLVNAPFRLDVETAVPYRARSEVLEPATGQWFGPRRSALARIWLERADTGASVAEFQFRLPEIVGSL